MYLCGFGACAVGECFTDSWMEGGRDGGTDGWMDGWMDGQSCTCVLGIDGVGYFGIGCSCM